jgi:UDP-N-acetyl-D-glucosamine dehydrogenase
LLTAVGFTIGKDIFLAFSPERVDPGNPTYNTRNSPRVVGGITADRTELATAFYASCIEMIIPVSSTETAELVKLLENTFRSVNIAMANQMAIICNKARRQRVGGHRCSGEEAVRLHEVHARSGHRWALHRLDPHYIAWKMRTPNYRTRFIELAGEINSEMPTFVVEKVSYALNLMRKPRNGSKILVLGLAYKRDIDDVRESPALDVMRLLESRGGIVSYHDPFIATVREDDGHGTSSTTALRHSVPLTAAALRDADLVVIVTDHSSIDYQQVVDCASIVVDKRNALASMRPGRAHVVTLSIDPLPDAGALLGQRSAVHAGCPDDIGLPPSPSLERPGLSWDGHYRRASPRCQDSCRTTAVA